MKEYKVAVNLRFYTELVVEANSKEEAMEEITYALDDHKLYFADEMFDFDEIEILEIKESK
jgi:hypothetical protein